MSYKSELRVVDYDGMQMTTVGLVPGGVVSKEGILAHLVSLNFFQAGINWCVGDLILEGTAAFGEDWVLQATMDHLSAMSESTQIQCQWVAQRYPHEKRLNRLSWTHHLVAAGMDCETERTLLLESCMTPSKEAPGRSEDQPMGVSELRRAVRAAKLDGEEDSPEVKLLAAAKRACERLAEEERTLLASWLAATWDWDIEGVSE